HAEVTVPSSGSEIAVTLVMEPSPLALGGVQVTVSPTGADPLQITQSTLELSGKALERNLRTSLAQTLENSPGISTRYQGPGATLPVIRGLTGERILVLQDGKRTGDLAAGSSDHSLSIDPLAANRIEVV